MNREPEDAPKPRRSAEGTALGNREPRDPHPDPIELLEFQLGNLSEPQRSELASHCDGCPDCAKALADFAAFPTIDDPERPSQTPSEIEESFRQIEARLESVTPAVGKLVDFPKRRVSWTRPLLAAAALFCAFGLGWWGRGVGGEGGILIADVPRLRASSQELHNAIANVSVHTDGGYIAFVLDLTSPVTAEMGRLELIDRSGRILRVWRGKRLVAETSLMVAIKRDSVPSGKLTFRLVKEGGAVFEEFDVVVPAEPRRGKADLP